MRTVIAKYQTTRTEQQTAFKKPTLSAVNPRNGHASETESSEVERPQEGFFLSYTLSITVLGYSRDVSFGYPGGSGVEAISDTPLPL